jgi:hypothetical protein
MTQPQLFGECESHIYLQYLFWSMSILFSSFRGPDPVRIRIQTQILLKSIPTHGPKSEAIEILKVHMAFTLTKIVEIGPVSRYGQICEIRVRNTDLKR